MEVNITQEANFVGKSSIPTIINGAGIKSIEQTKISTEDGGTNTLTVITTDGEETEFVVKNGSKGETGSQGSQGSQGPKGDKGDKGDTGAAFTYNMFTAEQLASLVGPKGDKGDTGVQGPKGDTPVKGTDYFTDAEKQEMANTAASLVDISTPDWNQNDSTANDYIKNRPFYTEGENTTLLSEQEITFSSDGYELSFLIEIDKNYIVEFDGVQYKCKAYKKEIIAGEIYIPCINTTSDIFYIEGTHMHASDNATHTVAIYEYNTIVKTLDEEFIPDTIARTSDVPIVDQILDLDNLTTNAISSRSVGYALNSIHSSISSINNDIDLLYDNPSDWDLNDASSPGYIRNKTHYIIYNTRQEITATDLGIALGDPNNTNKYTFKIDNLLYTKYSISYDSSDTVQRYPIVTAGTYRVKVDKTGITSPVYTPSDVTWTIYSQSVLSIKQLDEQFIPDTIARTSDIPTMDTDVTVDGANPVSGAAVAAYVAENGGNETWELIADVTLTEEVVELQIFSGTTGYKKISGVINYVVPTTNTATANKELSIYTDKTSKYNPMCKIAAAMCYNADRRSVFFTSILKDYCISYSATNVPDAGAGVQSYMNYATGNNTQNYITSLSLFGWGAYFGIGSTIKIYGVRA